MNDAKSNDIMIDNITITSDIAPLEVKLGDFSARNIGRMNRVTWRTVSETKGDVMTVERSGDGMAFTPLTTMQAKGKASNYSFDDIDPLAGMNHYRLKLLAANGNYQYSKTVSVSTTAGNDFGISVYPNPVEQLLYIKLSGTITGTVTLSLTDLSGRTLKSAIVQAGAATIDCRHLPQGLYLLKYMDGLIKKTLKVTKL